MPPNASLAAFRFGYGLPLAPDAPVSADAMLAALAGPDEMAARFPIVDLAWQHERTSEIAKIKIAAKTDKALAERVAKLDWQLERAGFRSLRATIARAVDAKDAFRERLVAFWADHFTISGGGPAHALMPYTFVEDAVRPHVGGHFADMLTAVVHHPGMLLYLDQTRSVGPNSVKALRRGGGLNENLARELLELHTMGVDAGYRQADVRQLAELLTGLTYDARRGYAFDRKLSEPGPEDVMGKRYGGKGEAPVRAFLADLAQRPETARHIARKLAVHFVSDSPDAAMLADMAQAWQDSGGALHAVYGAMLRHPAALAEPAVKARQPWDFLIASLRALGVSGAQVMEWPRALLAGAVIQPLRAMGQNWKSPPGPDGWPEDIESWITPQGLAERIGWAMRWPAVLGPLPEPVALAETALADRASEATLWAVVRAESRAEAVGIVFSSPEFNRR